MFSSTSLVAGAHPKKTSEKDPTSGSQSSQNGHDDQTLEKKQVKDLTREPILSNIIVNILKQYYKLSLCHDIIQQILNENPFNLLIKNQ